MSTRGNIKLDRSNKRPNYARDKPIQSSNANAEIVNCSEFERTGRCENINRCSFYHEGYDCIRWFTKSYCQYGARCKYKHRVVDVQPTNRDRTNPIIQVKVTSGGERRVNTVNEDTKSSDIKQDSNRDERRSNSRSRHDDKPISKSSSTHSERQRSSEYAREPTREDKPRMEDSHRNESKSKLQEKYPPKSSTRPKEREHHTFDKKTDYRNRENDVRSYDREKRKEPLETRNREEKEDKKERSSSERDLPPNWKICLSSRGEKYYYNHITGQSTWVHPEKTEERSDNRSREISKERDSGRDRSRTTSRDHKEKERSEDGSRSDKDRARHDPHWREIPPNYLPPTYDWNERDWRYRDIEYRTRFPYDYPPYHYDPYYKQGPGPDRRYYDYPTEDKHRDDRKRKRDDELEADKKRKKYDNNTERRSGQDRRETRDNTKNDSDINSGRTTPLVEPPEKLAEGSTGETILESEQPSPEQSPRHSRFISNAKKTLLLIPLEQISQKFAGKLLYSLVLREKNQISQENQREEPPVDFCLSCKSHIGPKNFAKILNGSYISCRACVKQKESEIYKTKVELLFS